MIQSVSHPSSRAIPIHAVYPMKSESIHFGKAPIQQMKDHYQSLEEDFNDIFTKSEQHPVTEKEPAPAWIKDMENLASNRKRWEKPVSAFMLEQPEHAKQLRHLQKEYERYSLLQEKNPPKAPPKLPDAPKENDYSQATGTFSDLEARVSGMSPGAKAVFIGSGSQPNTVLAYAKHAGHVTGLDIDPDAVIKAQEVTSNSPLIQKMEFLHRDGQELDYSPYTHVTIAAMVPNEQKLAILRRISETAKPGTMVTIRSTNGLKQAMYAPLTAMPEDLKDFTQVATILGPDHVINQSVILSTKGPKKPLSLLA